MTRMTILTKTIVIGTLLTGILTPISPASGAVQGFVAGRAFLDVNENGKRDAGEGTAFSLYKVTNGGSYFSCGYTGKGSTFGVPVSAGTYWVMPIAPKGFRTTTPIIKAEAGTDKPNIVEIGIVQDVSAPTDYCGQYSPKRVIRQNGLGLLETALRGGVSPRVSPFPELRDGAALLQRAGFALPVADAEDVALRYRNALALFADLRAAGEGNAVAARDPRSPPRALLPLAASRLPADDQGVVTSLRLIMLTGWAPAEGQAKPARPGSATARLADALGVEERSAGEKSRR